ncbi:hypothetical protein ST42_02330 [Prevotella pectinovora]|uniref:hypothetical protein n=1 Tax=Prevotella pectinovora TaxID=1602169 RepID=UPI0005B6BDED|nr:hypothetical protein [Prevotella pectinovora]KIP57992.1 hypothetical protein ST42_02330 [Prevotella pectinovora]
MKKIYISPETTLIKVHTENVMNNTSIGVKTYKDLSAKKDEVTMKNYNFSDKGISIWNGTSQPETAKDNNGFNLWGDED